MAALERLREARSRVARVTRVQVVRRLGVRLDLVAKAVPENHRLAEVLEGEITALEGRVAEVAERRLAARDASHHA